jgi:hypothetical protein
MDNQHCISVHSVVSQQIRTSIRGKESINMQAVYSGFTSQIGCPDTARDIAIAGSQDKTSFSTHKETQ